MTHIQETYKNIAQFIEKFSIRVLKWEEISASHMSFAEKMATVERVQACLAVGIGRGIGTK